MRNALCSPPVFDRWTFTKTLMIMKFTAIFLFIAAMQVSAEGFSQKVTFSGKDVPLEQVFTAIKKQTGYVVFYEYTVLEEAKKVTVNVKNVPVEQLLDECFRQQPFTYAIEGKTILVTKKSLAIAPPKNEGVLPRPPIDIKGRIVNEDGEPVVASVMVKGTNNGTATNNEGYFELLNVDENAILVITGVSIETVEVKVNGRTTITVTAKTRISQGEDITVSTGYWTTDKKTSLGNITKVTAKEIEKQPVTNPLQALIGRTPGVFIQQASGVPGGGFVLQIRGLNSVRDDGNAPLYLVDGVPFPATSLSQGLTATVVSSNPLNAISPHDIESIEILKDADATAIYGSRGANGVVLITTKKGKSGKTKVDLNLSTGVSKAPVNNMQLLNTQQYLQMRREAFANDNVTPTAVNAPDLLVWDTTRYTDWRKLLVGGTAHTTNARASVSGGNANTQFLFSSNYMKETTVFPGDFAFQRGGSHFNLNHTDNSRKFTVNLSATYTVSQNNLPQADLMTDAYTLPPNAPAVYDNDGKLNWAMYSGANTWDNPFSYLGRTYEVRTNNLNTNLLLGYRLLPFLNFKTSLGYSNTQNKEYVAIRRSYLSPSSTINTSLGLGQSSVSTWIAEPQLEFQKKAGQGTLTALLGATFNESIMEGQRFEGSNFSSEILVNNIAAASTVRALGNNYTQYRYSAGFARLGYQYKEKYLANLTARRDASSRFGSGNQFGNFGAAGAGWIFSKEKFIEKALPFLSFGKLRVSYGTTGSDQIGDYRYLDTYAPTFWSYVTGGLAPVRLANPDYGWEVNKKFEAGFEAGFFHDRLMLSASYFRNRSSNQLIGLPLPFMTGFSDVQINLPATVQNTGWELEWQSTNIRNKEFTWTSSFNLTIPNSRLIAFPYLKDLPSFVSRFVVGEPITTSQRYTYMGVDPATGNYLFVDYNDDNALTLLDDRKSLVNLGPRLFGGLSNTFSYKGIQLSFLFQFVKREYPGVEFGYGMPGTRSNQPVAVLNRWQKPGDIAEYRRFSRGSGTNYSNWLGSDAVVTDVSYIRLRNVALSWDIPQAWINKVKLQSSRLYLQCQNLLTFTGNKGPDPESFSISSVPPLRTIVAGIQVTL